MKHLILVALLLAAASISEAADKINVITATQDLASVLPSREAFGGTPTAPSHEDTAAHAYELILDELRSSAAAASARRLCLRAAAGSGLRLRPRQLRNPGPLTIE